MEAEGHETLFPDKGKNGSLLAIVHVVEEADRWRSGTNIHSRHFITLGEAIEGCQLSIPTIHGASKLELGPLTCIKERVFVGQGVSPIVADMEGTGDHIC